MVARLRKRLYVIAAIGLPAVAAAQSVPDVIGPIPANLPPGTDLTHNYPKLSSEPTDNLSSRGYVEEEFFFQGAATSYATQTSTIPAKQRGRLTVPTQRLARLALIRIKFQFKDLEHIRHIPISGRIHR